MEPFKEKKIVNILDLIAACLLGTFVLCVFLMIFNPMFGIGLLSIPLGVVLVLISNSISNKEKYTREFLTYIRKRLLDAKTLEDHKDVLADFEKLATDGKGRLCLKFPVILKAIFNEINNKIEILEKQ